MAFQIRYTVNVDYVGAGCNRMGVPAQQTIQFQGSQQVPGGETPSAANFSTADTAMQVDIDAQIAAVLTRIQAFATGGG